MKTCSFTLERLIDILNNSIRSIRIKENIPDNSILVLHKSITQSPVIKAYKTYEYALWLVYPDGKKGRVFTVRRQDRVLSDSEQGYTEYFEELFIRELFNGILSEGSLIFNNIVYGRYIRDNNEQIPDSFN